MTAHSSVALVETGAVPVPERSAVQRFALDQLNRFISFEPKVVAGEDPDAVHDMRVASRRLQQALDLLFPVPQGEIRRLRRRIKRYRNALSEVRNCDVLLAHVDRNLVRRSAAGRETWIEARAFLRKRRVAKHEQALRKVRKLNLVALYIGLKESLQPPSPPAEDNVAPAPSAADGASAFASQIRDVAGKAWGEFEQRVNEARSSDGAQNAAWHAVRLAAKRMRYLSEVLTDGGIESGDAALAWLRLLQRRLGDWRDLEVMDEMFARMIGRPKFVRASPKSAAKLLRLMSRNRARKQRRAAACARVLEDRAGHGAARTWATRLAGASAGPTAIPQPQDERGESPPELA